MAQLGTLRSHLSEVGELLVQADGYALWMVWHGSPNPVALQMLEDYGGLKITDNGGQALWYFFSLDVLLAAARLGVWARFNPLPLALQIFPARFQCGQAGGKNLIFDESLWQQTLTPPEGFKIWVHASMHEAVETSPGLSLEPLARGDSLDPDLWRSMAIDARLPYQSPLSWYAVLRPVGNVQDKNFLLGWREFFAQLEALLQRNKLRFSLYDFFLVFPLEGLRQVKSWCRDYLLLVERLKAENPERYWPCVVAIADKKGMSQNEDLPGKVGVDWEHLNPDYPHMSMRNALMLGDEFSTHPVRFAPVRHQPDDWGSISLKSGEDAGGAGVLPQLAPVNLIFGNYSPCFYCGQRNHATRDCPSRTIDPQAPSVWTKMAQLDFAAMRDEAREIDSALERIEGEEARLSAIATVLHAEGRQSVMLKAFYDLTWPVQFRSASFFWRARNKDLEKAAKNLASLDKSPAWEVLETFAAGDPQEVGATLKALSVKHPKDFRVACMRGFWAAEQGEYDKAEKYWKEAEINSPHPIVQAWHCMLQARAMECRGEFAQAAALYDQVSRACPDWLDAEYRKTVCRIKSGFTESALQSLCALIDKSGHFFNKALIDPEMERGHIQVMACLYKLWTSLEARAKDEENNLKKIRAELGTWFMPDNLFAEKVAEGIDKVLRIAAVQNYVAAQRVVTGRVRIERDIQAHVLEEAREYKSRFRSYASRLKQIHEESAWFPFPRTLVEFNRSYNEGVANSNWAMTTNLHSPEAFRKAQILVEQEATRLEKLEGRLKFLRIVRDSTLFILSVAETFLWLEIVGIVLIFVILPLFLLYGDKLGFDFAVGAVAKERWQVQKALFVVVSVLAFGVASLRTLLRFETIRDGILAKAKAGPPEKKKKKR